ncbi:hypothetical protein [Acidisoma cladoniae]|uniref:hypothetical protein n=1 Tax=Acidisoma cladoniae TaxID=3040935 RepID=UPI00254CED89|nr:hypothetical protein [Acidisoma sp. PAMC 29798]
MAKITADQLARLQQKADQHNARLQAAKARLLETERKLDTRRKIIAGGLLFDAAAKDKQWAKHLSVLLSRIDRPNDKDPFEGWSIAQYKAEGGKLGARKQAMLDANGSDEVQPAEARPAEARADEVRADEEDDLTPEDERSTASAAE